MARKKSEDSDLIISLSEKGSISRFSTGSLVLDQILGGGIPKNKLIRIYGPAGTGKSTLAYCFLRSAQKEGSKVLVVDAEFSLDKNYATKMGLNPDLLFVTTDKVSTIKQAVAAIGKAKKKFDIDVVLIDSVTALKPEIENITDLEDELKLPIGAHARELAEYFRILLGYAAEKNLTIITIAQTRMKIDAYHPSEYITGGKAYEYYSHLDIKVSEDRRQSTDKVKYLNIETTKNKTYISGQKCMIKLDIGKGIDEVWDLYEYLRHNNYITEKGPWLNVKGIDKNLQKFQILDYISTHLEEVKEACLKHIRGETEEIMLTINPEDIKSRSAKREFVPDDIDLE